MTLGSSLHGEHAKVGEQPDPAGGGRGEGQRGERIERLMTPGVQPAGAGRRALGEGQP